MLNLAVINDDLLDSRADLLGATDLQIEAARTSALRKMRTRIENRVKRRVAKEERIPQRALSGRFFSDSVEPGDEELRVWIGTWHLSPFAVGAPKLYGTPGQSGGVRVGRRSYPGAFLAEVYTLETKVWIRLYSKHYSQDLYPTIKRSGDRGASSLSGRFPVVRAAIPVDGAIRAVFESEGDQIANEFEKLFLAELNYQKNIKGDRA